MLVHIFLGYFPKLVQQDKKNLKKVRIYSVKNLKKVFYNDET